MGSVTIYVEGGGDSKEIKARCREGFSKLIRKMGFDERMPKIVACGARDKAYGMFNNAVASAEDDEFPLLLVDSEDPVASGSWDHLMARDRWGRPDGVDDEQAQMMVACMETWIMADHDTLRCFFGSCLRESALIPARNLEMRSRQEVQEALFSATNDCGRHRGYEKGTRSFQILAKLNPVTLEKDLRYFRRFKEALKRHL